MKPAHFPKIIFLFVLFLLAGGCSSEKGQTGPQVNSFYYDNQLQKALKDKNPELALDLVLKILENEPQAPQVHSNLGLIFDMLQKKNEAGQSFKQAEQLVEKYKIDLSLKDQFIVYYNLGVFHGAQKNISEALAFYQKALELNPSSKEIKHNIELLIQQQKQQQKQQQQQNGQGSSSSENNQQKQDQKKESDKDQNKKDQDKDQNKQNQPQERDQTGPYKPRPFKGDQLSEGDVKKILGELSQQDKKIRSQYNKKERKEDRSEKDW